MICFPENLNQQDKTKANKQKKNQRLMKKFYNIMGYKINISKKKKHPTTSLYNINQLKTVMEKESCLKN